MSFWLTPRSMTLDDREVYKFEFSENFSGFRTQQQLNEWRQTSIGSDNVVSTSEQFLACFRVARVCQRQLGFIVLLSCVLSCLFFSKLCLVCVMSVFWICTVFSSMALYSLECWCVVKNLLTYSLTHSLDRMTHTIGVISESQTTETCLSSVRLVCCSTCSQWKSRLVTKRNQNVTLLNKFFINRYFCQNCIKALYMCQNNCVTKNYAHTPTQTYQLRTCNTLCICMQPYLFTFAQLKQLPKLFELFVKNNSKAFVFDRKFQNHDCSQT